MTEDRSPLDDAQIAQALQGKGLELEYLRELAAALGFDAGEPWSEEAFSAIEHASYEQRRAAALRTLRLSR